MTELKDFQQKQEETTTIYYEREVNMMVQVEVRERPISPTDKELSFLHIGGDDIG